MLMVKADIPSSAALQQLGGKKESDEGLVLWGRREDRHFR
jgi:hypothetical protein